MIEEQFSTGNSIIHGLDPRVKLIIVAFFSVIVAISSRFLALLPALAISLFLVAMAKLSIKKVFHRLLLVNGFILFLWLVLPFTYNGEEWFAIGPFVATKEGILLASQITVKSNSILLSMIALLSTTPIFSLGHAMGQLHFPNKITHLFLFTFRYIHVIYKEYRRLTNAMRVRGFVPRSNMHTYKSYAYLVGMLLVRSYDRAERIHKAMRCRGFNKKYHSLTQFSLKMEDIFCLSLMLAVISGLAVLQWVVTT
ncbi:MAG: cobalt ECF transporter T component CbiQ [Deltaproteobacteria bacterium]|nr:cobalt ECF transporter T component CbiQ [Deltaproteobacteria bacterium]MBW2012714.1 cobalt ECF transporter T component CbiQ [Deltaproteobacteria bacterium]MBW2088176.1 cobalt ECF transporter T component CbiQ [Deltaproteobacteria bacterium]MBW2321769.1 cobalt ECF transporter T component CbiQ [Deltaproteobacteria bacterium]